MCGIFGYVATPGRSLSLRQLERIAAATEARGRDAFGFAWVDRFGRIRSFRQCGRITEHLSMLSLAAGASMLIGHCRLATHGRPESNENNHPHRVDRGYFVHNGIVHNYRDLRDEHDLCMSSECDSEVIGLMIEQLHGSLSRRCVAAANAINHDSPFAMLGLWSKPRTLIAMRRNNPLHVSVSRDGIYLASLPTDLPGRPVMLPNASGLQVRFDRKGQPTLTSLVLQDRGPAPTRLQRNRVHADRIHRPARRVDDECEGAVDLFSAQVYGD